MHNAKSKNKGFTLVELIVVLVILAILAAILVPALLGYIDKAKAKQVVLNARSCYTAAQAEFSEMYAGNVVYGTDDGLGNNFDMTGDDMAVDIMNTADVPNCTVLTVGCDSRMKSGDHSGYTITFVYYQEGDKAVYFNGKSWIDTDSYPTSFAAGKYVYHLYMDLDI
jgi:prepilin-type N-terminal cleavage/methylation domain-containing protein